VRRVLVNAKGKHVGGGCRGSITCLSGAARRRLLHAARNTSGLETMLTLTYPGEYPTDGRKVKRDWAAMRKWLIRRGVGGFWFLEFQERGAPHLHAFLTGRVPYKEIAAAWYRIVGSGDPAHLKAGTRIQPIERKHCVAAYAAKYASKMEQKTVPADFLSVGRFWGLFGGLAITTHFAFVEELSAIAPLIRLARNLDRARRRSLGLRPARDSGLYGITFWDVGPQLRDAIQSLNRRSWVEGCG
jgi:hypothetical protein